MFKFNYKISECDGTSINNAFTYNSAEFRAAWHSTDFALMEIAQNLKDNVFLSWLGWNHESVSPSKGTCIHHPEGDVMKISLDENPLSFIDWKDSGNYNHWMTVFDEGIYEPGSSGSPLLDQDKRVIGQMHGGPQAMDECERNIGKFGRFDLSWTGGGTDDTRLSNWLDPIGSNQPITDTGAPTKIIGPTVPCGQVSYHLQDTLNSNSVSWSWEHTCSIPIVSNSPLVNQCTISNINHDYINNAIIATIYSGGICLGESRKVIDTGINFSGTYEQSAVMQGQSCLVPAIGPNTFRSGATLWLTKGSQITLKSEDFIGSNISYSGPTPQYFIHNDSTITFKYLCLIPLFNASPSENINLIITGKHPDNCETFQFTIRLLDPPSELPLEPDLEITQVDNGYEFKMLLPPSLAATMAQKDTFRKRYSSWHLSITNSSTGKVMFKGKIENASWVVNTTDWNSGTYIVHAQIGDYVVTKKIMLSK